MMASQLPSRGLRLQHPLRLNLRTPIPLQSEPSGLHGCMAVRIPGMQNMIIQICQHVSLVIGMP